jgi:hypothetical protein
MDKQQKFLWAVQFYTIQNSINLSLDQDKLRDSRHLVSFTGIDHVIMEALRVVEKIPDDLSAYEAALEFCEFMLPNIREADDIKLPAWVARPPGDVSGGRTR